jgi:hypothetical protein
VLDGDHEFGECVKSHDTFVVRGPQASEEMFRDGKEGNVLDIGIVFWVIRYEVVDVVVLPISSLHICVAAGTYITPPAETETTDVVGY